jgi:hypothetical protein
MNWKIASSALFEGVSSNVPPVTPHGQSTSSWRNGHKGSAHNQQETCQAAMGLTSLPMLNSTEALNSCHTFASMGSVRHWQGLEGSIHSCHNHSTNECAKRYLEHAMQVRDPEATEAGCPRHIALQLTRHLPPVATSLFSHKKPLLGSSIFFLSQPADRWQASALEYIFH